MKKDDIKTLIVVILVCAICIALILLFGMKKNVDKLEPVNDYSMYFSVSNYIKSFLREKSENNNQKVYNMLDSKYIENNGISVNNVNEDSFNSINDISFKITNMKYVKIKNNYMYVVNGSIVENTFEQQNILNDNYNLIVLSDLSNYTMAIYPIAEKNEKSIVNSINKINIEKNENNQMQSTGVIKKEHICTLYLSDYVNKIYSDISGAYSLLDKDMKEIYPDLNSFKKYIENNINNLITSADTCATYESKKKRIYTVIDKNKNKYIFTENNVMDYEVKVYLYE